MITQAQKDKKIEQAKRKIETLQAAYDGRTKTATKARAEADKLLALAERKEASAEAARVELAYAQQDLAHREAAPVLDATVQNATEAVPEVPAPVETDAKTAKTAK